MNSEYRLIKSRDRLTSFATIEKFSIGILDVASAHVLENSINWYSDNMNMSIYVVTTNERMSTNKLSSTYPKVNFICFNYMTSFGNMVNALSSVCYSTYFFAVTSETELLRFEGSALLDCIEKDSDIIMLSPVFINASNEIAESVNKPLYENKKIVTISSDYDLNNEKMKNLYPIYAIGLYKRALFQRLKGFDELITSPYYQMLDFGLRAHLLSYKIYTHSLLACGFKYRESIAHDTSNENGIKRCYTRALCVEIENGKNYHVKCKHNFDRKLYKEEIKKYQVKLQKIDYATLVKEWDKCAEDVED